MLRQFALACAALAALASAPIPASAQDRFALVIGNSKYKSVSALANPARDAEAVGALLKDAGFQVTSALDLDKSSMSRVIRFFTTNIAEKPENTVALIYFAGHGIQIDGENFLVPVDAAIAREADVPLEALRLADVMSMFETVRSRTRIVILDACRDNPFGDIAKTAPRGLALVNAPAGTLVAYSTSPGHTADDGSGSNSPFALALLKSAREPGLPIETALKNVRLAVHGATGGRQTPWEVSALTEPFSFFPGGGIAKPETAADKTADAWRRELRGMSARDAFAVAVREDNVVVYEQYLALFGTDPLASGLRSILDRRLMMLAWQEAVALNSAAGFAEFLARYPNSDLSATARRLQQRAQNRLTTASLSGASNLIRAVAPAGTCPCSLPGAPNVPGNPGSVPPGTRASIPSAPGGPGGPGTVVVPPPGGGPVTVVTPPPSGPGFVPSVPVVIPVPVITDPGRDRGGSHDRGHGDRKDSHYPKDDKKSSSAAIGDRGINKSSGTQKGDGGNKSDSTLRSGRDGKGGRDVRGGNRDSVRSIDRSHSRDVIKSRNVQPRIANRGGRNIGRNAAPRIAVPRHAARISAPRFAAPRNAPRFAAPRHNVVRMGGGGGFRMGGGGFRGGGFGRGGGFKLR